MYSSKSRDNRVDRPKKSKKDKQLSNLINNSDSDTGNDSEHELSYYIQDRVKLMKEVLKIIKPKKIKSMAPNCMKRMQIEEVNSMLLEELLGISNKRLKYIFEGKNLDEESSTDEDQPVDVISLDDISDDDFVIISDEETDKHNKKKKRKKVKEEPKEKSKKIKKEKPDKERSKERQKTRDNYIEKGKKKSSKEKEPIGEENLMSVLELLELQARARAIRSQLELESKRKKDEQDRLAQEQAEKAREQSEKAQEEDDEDVIIEVPKEVEIVITSSDSENEAENNKNKAHTNKDCTNTNSTLSTISITSNNEKTNESSISTKENSLQGNRDIIQRINEDYEKTEIEQSVNTYECDKEELSEGNSDREGKKECSNDKEEGEVSEDETGGKEKFGEQSNLTVQPIPPDDERQSSGDLEGNKKVNKDISSNGSSSSSDSNDNLQVVMLREKKKKKAVKKSEENYTRENKESQNSSRESVEKDTNSNIDNAQNPNENKHSKEVIDSKKQLEANADKNRDITSQQSDFQDIASEENKSKSQVGNDSDARQTESKIDSAVVEFLKTQPASQSQVSPDKIQKLQLLEETKKKEKRIKALKNKLQSYKKDVEGENTVTILENIVIKPKVVDPAKSGSKVAEDSDDLVINVDQDDLDCIVCD